MQKTALLVVIGILSIVAIALWAAPPAENRPRVAGVTEIKSPAGVGSEEPNLAMGNDGTLYLSWLERVEPDAFALRFSSRRPNSEWSAPQTIASGKNWFISYADFPSVLSLPDGTLAAHWLVNIAEDYLEAYNLYLSISHDGGAHWSEPIIPYKDRTETQHGLVSLTGTHEGRIGVVWLDGRKATDVVTDISLMYTSVGADGSVNTDSELDGRVCECCQTATALTPDGLLVVYRDRSDKEIRDIAIVNYQNGQWSQPHLVATDNWEIDACPINGPAISAQGQNVAVAWFTAPEDKARVRAAFSGDGGKTFGTPVMIDEGNPIGRVDIQMLPSGSALVSWIEAGKIRVRRVNSDGTLAAPMTVSETSMSASSGFPKMERSGNEVIVAWTQPGEPNQARTAVIR